VRADKIGTRSTPIGLVVTKEGLVRNIAGVARKVMVRSERSYSWPPSLRFDLGFL
jgi:hypothetical protein